MIKVVDGALDLALPLLEQMARQGIAYEELASRQITGSTPMDLVNEDIPVTPFNSMCLSRDESVIASGLMTDCMPLSVSSSSLSDPPLFLGQGELGPLEFIEVFAPLLQPVAPPQPPLIPVLCHPLYPLQPLQPSLPLPANPDRNLPPLPHPPPFMTPFGPLPNDGFNSLPMTKVAHNRGPPPAIRVPSIPTVPQVPLLPSFVASGGAPAPPKPVAKRAVTTKGDDSQPTRKKSTASKPKRSASSPAIGEKDPNIAKAPRARKTSTKPSLLADVTKRGAQLSKIQENVARATICEEDAETEVSGHSKLPKSSPRPARAKKTGLSRRQSMPVVSKTSQEGSAPFTSEPTRRSRRLSSARA